ncbi:MAG: single-stranded-DNA-specific exonuclease RecJ [Parcubacteria group bacterium]|nr:single-stranded-DNA-specific exonuclease RecJ [Parcubacteria group bacterium]
MRNGKVSEAIDEGLAAEFPDVNRVILQLLSNRGITSRQDVDEFLNPTYENLHDPFLFRDMQKAVDRVKVAREENQTVFVYGDYDADGVTSSVLLVETLRLCGVTNAAVYLPHREKEGYGLNNSALDYIAAQGAQLLITVDCGTSAVAEVAYARSKGLDVIICDHHEEPPALPQDVAAFLNPHLAGETYPFQGLAAAGVAFKFASALWKSFELPAGREKWFLDLVAIATVADMMELKGENRVFVAFGLKVLGKTKRAGLQSLLSGAQIDPERLGTYEIGFMVAPRLNAAGRIDHASTAFELLETADSGRAAELAESLNQTNRERQSETVRITKEAEAQVKGQLPAKVLLAKGEDWPLGVVGLVSGRITEQFFRPSLVVTRSEKGLVGSGRSIPGFNITQALAEASEYLERFGGHEGACGFTLKRADVLDDFIAKLNAIADAKLSEKDLVKSLDIDMELSLNQVDWELVLLLKKLEPHGVGNPVPKFISYGLRVADVFLMGQEGQHMRIKLRQGGTLHQAVAFGFGQYFHGTLNQDDLIDVVYTIEVNEWNGRRDIQLKVVAIKKE